MRKGGTPWNWIFTGKVALITGAANGIGRATALAFAKSGAKVVVVDRDAAGGEATAGIIRQQGGEARFVAADVTKSADVAAYVKAALDAYGRIDCFHNNAGIEGKVTHTAEYDEAMFDQVIAVNVKGVFLGLAPRPAGDAAAEIGGDRQHRLGRRARRHPGDAGLCRLQACRDRADQDRRRRGRAQRRAGQRGLSRPGRHQDDPFARRTARPERPGARRRRYQAAIPTGRYTTPEEIANMVLFLCSDLSSNTTGGQYVVDGARTATGGAVTQALGR